MFFSLLIVLIVCVRIYFLIKTSKHFCKSLRTRCLPNPYINLKKLLRSYDHQVCPSLLPLSNKLQNGEAIFEPCNLIFCSNYGKTNINNMAVVVVVLLLLRGYSGPSNLHIQHGTGFSKPSAWEVRGQFSTFNNGNCI